MSPCDAYAHSSTSACCVRVGIPVDGLPRWMSNITAGISAKYASPMNSCISEMPGPEVAVNARAPFQAAPITMPIEASSSSAWTIAYLCRPVAGSTRSLRQCLANASASDDDGVIGYHAQTVAPPYTQPSAAALLPSMKIRSPTASRALDAHRQRAGEMGKRVIASERQRLPVRFEQRLLAAILLGEELLDLGGVDREQRGQRAQVDDVLEELPLARVGVRGVADRGERHAEDVTSLAEARRRKRARRVVEEVAAALELADVLVPGLRVHRDHQVDAAAAAAPACGRDAHLVPRRQPLDVRREDVARRHRHAHPQDRLGEQRVGRCRARAVDVGELDDEVVDPRDRFLGASCHRAHSAATPAISLAARPLQARAACGSGRAPGRARTGISACPMRRSGSARRIARSAGRRPRPSPSRGPS